MSDSFNVSNPNAQTTYPKRAANQDFITPGQSDQWLRKIELVVYDPANGEQGEALNLTPEGQAQFQVVFQVRKTTTQSPNLLFARVYNLRRETENKIITYRRVQLSAGYKTGRFGIIFKGTVVQYRRGRDNSTDTYLEIEAGDGDQGLGYDVVTGVWASGTTVEDQVKDYLAQVKGTDNQPISVGEVNLGDAGKEQLIRSMSQQRMAANSLRDMSNSFNSDWYIDDGQHFFLARTAYRSGEVAVLTPSTGLLGIPEVTPIGIQARCYLNPNLKLGGLVEIKTDIISGVPYTPGTATQLDRQGNPVPTGSTRYPVATWGQQLSSAFTSPVGKYKIVLLEFSGEIRGFAWYADMVCVALDETGNTIPSPELPYGRTIVPI